MPSNPFTTPQVRKLLTGLAFPSRRIGTMTVCGSPIGERKRSLPSISAAAAKSSCGYTFRHFP